MVAESSAPRHSRRSSSTTTPGRLLYSWFRRNEAKFFAIDIICVILLFFMYLFTSTVHVLGPGIVNILQLATIVLVSFIALSVVWKGVVPLIICVVGITLMHNSIILPYYSAPEQGEANFGGTRFVWTLYTAEAVKVASTMHFFVGASMVAFSIIIAYRPSMLFTKNRPEPLDAAWSKYPVWYDNTMLEGGHMKPSVPVKSLMTDQDRYLLWRYEYVLASIYGTPHLVRPDGLVPKNSTTIFRDKESGRIIGKARYMGYFV